MMISELLDQAVPEHSLLLNFLYVRQWVPFICFSSCVLTLFALRVTFPLLHSGNRWISFPKFRFPFKASQIQSDFSRNVAQRSYDIQAEPIFPDKFLETLGFIYSFCSSQVRPWVLGPYTSGPCRICITVRKNSWRSLLPRLYHGQQWSGVATLHVDIGVIAWARVWTSRASLMQTELILGSENWGQ